MNKRQRPIGKRERARRRDQSEKKIVNAWIVLLMALLISTLILMVY